MLFDGSIENWGGGYAKSIKDWDFYPGIHGFGLGKGDWCGWH